MSKKILFPNSMRKFSRIILYQALLLGSLDINAKTTIPVPRHVQTDKTITGKITDENSVGLPGVSIVLKGTTSGTISDSEGSYKMTIPDNGAILIYSYVGYLSQEKPVGNSTNIDVMMQPDARNLNEVVVTALGIKQETKRLGYAVQELKGTDLDKARETNFVSGLAGKIAGVQVMSSPSGIGGSARITIRGDKSLDINKNQPLFVIDGVPITNALTGSSGRDFQELDYGNGASMINPDDVESMTVLKGANASALYGSRGANGVIVITTK